MESYRMQLDGLQQIRKLTRGVDLSLPQIVVVGDQSSGKSSLLTELTGITFPVNAGICTKAPIVVQCTRNEALEQPVFKVGDERMEVTVDNLAKHISALQDAALRACNGSKISSNEIRVEAEGSPLPDIILVDLPGIINVGEGKDETRSLIKKYVKKDTTLIMLVSEAKQDDELASAIELAREADSSGHRTMRVLTKFDTFDSESAKERASKLVGQDTGSDTEQSTMDLSAHAVVCRASGGQYNEAFESDKLSHLPKSRAGVASLKARLPAIFSTLIKKNLRILEEDIHSNLESAQRELDLIGEDAMSSAHMTQSAQEMLSKSTEDFELGLTVHTLVFQEAVHATKRKITRDWAQGKYASNSFRNPLFQGEFAVDQCMNEIGEWWRQPLDTLLQKVKETTHQHVHLILRNECRLPPHFVDAICKEWRHFWTKQDDVLTGACNEELRRAVRFGTMNHYLTAKFDVDTILPEQCLIDLVEDADDTDEIPVTIIRNRWQAVKAAKEKELENQSIHDRQKEKVFRAVQAQWAVEHKSFIDNILKTVQKHVLDSRTRWVAHTLYTNNDIQDSAVEDKATHEKRTSVKDTIERLRQALEQVGQIKLL